MEAGPAIALVAIVFLVVVLIGLFKIIIIAAILACAYYILRQNPVVVRARRIVEGKLRGRTRG